MPAVVAFNKLDTYLEHTDKHRNSRPAVENSALV